MPQERKVNTINLTYNLIIPAFYLVEAHSWIDSIWNILQEKNYKLCLTANMLFTFHWVYNKTGCVFYIAYLIFNGILWLRV